MLSLISRLPLGGKLSTKLTDEGQLHFRKFENISNRLRPLFFRNFFRNIQKTKNVLHPSFASLSLSTFPPRGRLNYCLILRLPLGGRLRLKVGGEGRNLFSFIRQYRYCNCPSFASLSLSTFPPQGEGYNIAYLFPIIFCNSAINDEISLNERYTEA